MRRVERLNARAGIYALSLSLWHGMKIVACFSVVIYCLPPAADNRSLSEGRPANLTPPCRRSVLRALEHGTQGRAPSGQDEEREAVRQDVLFGKLGLGLVARRGQRAGRREFDRRRREDRGWTHARVSRRAGLTV